MLIVDILDADQVKIDLKPLYQCLHIYDELGQRTEFKSNYSEDRRAQAKLTLSSITSGFNFKDRNTDNFESLLQDIVGFFIVEHIILHSTTNFRTQAQVTPSIPCNQHCMAGIMTSYSRFLIFFVDLVG